MKTQSLAICNVIDVETELFGQGTSGEYILLRTASLPERIAYLRILLHLRDAAAPLSKTRYILKPTDINRDGLILLRLPAGLPLALAELRLDLNHTRGPASLIKIVPDRKEVLWKNPLLQS